MESKNVEKETTNKTKKKMNFQKRIFQSKYLSIMFLALVILGSGYNIRINDVHKRETKSTLQSTSKSLNHVLSNSETNYKLATVFYKKLNYQPLWTVGFQQNQYAESLENILVNSRNYGIQKNDELEKDLQELKAKMVDAKSLDKLSHLRAKYEVKLSEAALKTLIQLDKGIIYCDTLNNEKIINDYADYLIKSVQADNFEKTYLNVQPENKIYHQLVQGLKQFLDRSTLSKSKHVINIENFESVRKTATPIFYELGYTSNKENLDSTDFVSTLKTFQKYHGINQSGTLCDETISALEMSSYERYQKIVLNIERARAEEIMDETYIYVNIPAYNLKLFRDGELEVQHKVMVGKPKSQTPVLSSKMEFMVANPKWYVPKSISRGEILYKLRKDSTYLEKRNFVLLDQDYKTISQSDINWSEVNYSNFNYKIYQEPGSGNALGQIKFMFPNDFSVYVHDTQSKKLFNNDYRAYSHGCVRLENPLDFADHLLTHVDTDNLYKTIKPIVKSKKTKEIRFTEPIDIHIRYYTCDVDENNRMYFLKDIYEKDEILKEQIFLN